jgi:hypothetical protein
MVRVRCVGINPPARSTNLRVRQASYVTCCTFPAVLLHAGTQRISFIGMTSSAASSSVSLFLLRPAGSAHPALAMPGQKTASTKPAPVAPGHASLLFQGHRPAAIRRIVQTRAARLSDRFDTLLTPMAPSSLHSYDMDRWGSDPWLNQEISRQLHGSIGTEETRIIQ